MEIISSHRNQMIDITIEVREFIKGNNINEGIITIFIPHTTAAVTINENADSSVQKDILFSLEKISPILKEFRHLEGNSDAHVKASLVGISEHIIVKDSQLQLGIWQGIYFCEFDGPRHRKILLTAIK